MKVDRAVVVHGLVERGTRRDIAVQYADAFVEYQDASTKIVKLGAMIRHPKTGNPIENPYLVIRDRALKKLQTMPNVNAAWLW